PAAPLPPPPALLRRVASAPIDVDGLTDARNQLLRRYGFPKEVDGAAFERPNGGGNVGVPGHHDDGQRGVPPAKLVLQIQTAIPPKTDVQDEATRSLRVPGLEEFRGGGIRGDRQTLRLDERLQRFADARIVVDHEDRRDCCHVDRSPVPDMESTGRSSRTVVPNPDSRGATESRPWCSSTMVRLIARPIPIPCGLVVKKGSYNTAVTSAATPVTGFST